MSRDYYEVLGLKPGATEAEIRSAYKRLARRYHPDVNPGDRSAEETFKEITEAHQVLTDPQKRRQYDALRTMGGASRRPGASHAAGADPFGAGFGARGVDFSAAGFEDFGTIFSDLFGRSAQGRPNRGQDLEYEASIEFEEAVHGTTLTVPLARNAACPACGGSGEAPGSKGGRCRRCGGDGLVRTSDVMKVRIAPGAEDGSRVRVAGGGDAGRRGGPAGDLYIVLGVKPHRHFRREGSDILLEVPLSYAEAALGARVEVPTLEGRATVTIPPGTRSGQKFRLRGRGVPHREGGGRGDQIVMVAIVPPGKADAKVRELLRELEALDNGDPRRDLDF